MATTRTSQAGPGLARTLTLLERRVAARLGAALQAADATIDEWRVLSLLGDGAGHPMSEIADFAMLPAPTLTKIVDRLVSSGLVYRRVDDADRRRVLAFLAEAGEAALSRIDDAVRAEWDGLAEAVGREELALLEVLLARMADRLC